MASELDYSTTPGSNVAINGVGIAGTDLPSNLDNAMREIAANRANAQPRAILKTANYAATKDDFGKTFVFSGAFQLTIPTIATLATGWNVYAEAASASALTIVRSGSNTLNGSTSITLAAGRRCQIFVSQSSTDIKVDFFPSALTAAANSLLGDAAVPRLGTANSWSQINGFSVAQVGMPSDFWLATSSYYAIGAASSPNGGVSHESSSGVYLTSNGYRNNAGTWTSYAIGGATGASQVELLPTGVINFKTDAVKASGSAIMPTIRMTMLADGKLGVGTQSPVSEFQVVGTATATAFSGSGASLTNLPAGQMTGAVPIANGGTGQTTAAAALNALGGVPSTRSLGTGVGLSGLGDLSANRTVSLAFGDLTFSNAGIANPRVVCLNGAANGSEFRTDGAGFRSLFGFGPLSSATGTAPASNVLLAGFNSSGAFVTMLAPTNSLAMQSTVNNDSWFGTDLSIGNGGTGASTAAAARSNLGIGPLGALTGTAPASNYLLSGFDSSGNAITFGPVPTSGSLALQTTINNANWNGTDLAVANGGTGASDAATARTNLGLGAFSTLAAGAPAPAGQVKLAGIDAAGAAAYAGSIDTSNSLAFQSTVNNADWVGTDLSIANGGTGASTATDAMIAFINGALGVPPAGSIRIFCQTATGVPSAALINTSTGAISGITAL